jgi:hypothetical protein
LVFQLRGISLKYWNDIEVKARVQAGITFLQTIVTAIGGIAIFWNIVMARRQVAATQQQMVIIQEQIILRFCQKRANPLIIVALQPQHQENTAGKSHPCLKYLPPDNCHQLGYGILATADFLTSGGFGRL